MLQITRRLLWSYNTKVPCMTTNTLSTEFPGAVLHYPTTISTQYILGSLSQPHQHARFKGLLLLDTR